MKKKVKMAKVLFIMFLFLFIYVVAFAADISLWWDANTESDLAGYNLYYKINSFGAPYDGIGAYEGDSPVNIPLNILSDLNNPEFTIYGLDAGYVYFLVLTAYDTANNESGFSNEVTTFYVSLPSGPFVINSNNYTAFLVQGRAAGGVAVSIYSNGTEVATVMPDAGGAWSVNIDFTGVTEGQIIIEARTNASPLPSNNVAGTLNYSAPDPPTITESLVVTSVTQAQVSLEWEDVPQATGYIIYRNGSEKDRTIDNQYTDVGLSPATTYEYEISTVNNVNIKSNLESATTLDKNNTPPVSGGGSNGSCFINTINF